MVGFNNISDLRYASRQKKAETATVKTPMAATTEKPVTNTSGTANTNKGGGSKGLMKQIEKGMNAGGAMGAVMGFMGVPFKTTKGAGGRMQTVDIRMVGEGSGKPTPKPDPNAGIDAPAPDTGWRPSGTQSASTAGLQQTQMGVPLQETVGVSKRRR